MIICIDSQIVVWGIKNEANKGQESMIVRAMDFFRWADEQGHEILIPSIVISEILAVEPISNYARYIEIINKNCRVVDFDVFAAIKYSQMFYDKFGELKALANDGGIRREKMKLDHLIIACALAGNADCIYSYDEGLAKFAAGIIDVRKFPPLRVIQTGLAF